jgi:hypothetical protein
VTDATLIAFRESAKTSDAKIAMVWLIARKVVIDSLRTQGEDVSHWGERLYINVDCYDKNNAESILFDVVTELQTNSLLVVDFGQLYNKPRTKDEATLKRISNFVTNNRIRVEAHTALTPMRGRLYQEHRPDFVLRDDLANLLRFLSRFEALFTLNQDTLLEQKYPCLTGQEFLSFSNGLLFGAEAPGLRNAHDKEWMPPGFYTVSTVLQAAWIQQLGRRRGQAYAHSWRPQGSGNPAAPASSLVFQRI